MPQRVIAAMKEDTHKMAKAVTGIAIALTVIILLTFMAVDSSWMIHNSFYLSSPGRIHNSLPGMLDQQLPVEVPLSTQTQHAY